MRILILSDIHSNYVALETVLNEAEPFDTIWNLGDTIGYGPAPNECLISVRQRASVMLAGNHDLACLGRLDLDDFNDEARAANLWNGNQLLAEQRQFLDTLPAQCDIDTQFHAAHGSPREPVWEYLLERYQAEENFEEFDQQVCLVGHSHVQMFFRLNPEGRIERTIARDGQVLRIDPATRYIINPGSVGQPRDNNPRAAFALLDRSADTVTFRRVRYNIRATQAAMRQAGLPEVLARRLDYGI